MQKKILVNIKFNKEYKCILDYIWYTKTYNNIKNKNFVWCCDLLIIKNYKEFEKVLKKEYLSMDNGIIIIDAINLNDVDHFKYILEYVEIYNIENILLYCLTKGLFKIVDYILNNNPEFKDYGNYIELSLFSHSLKFYNKYKDKCEYLDYNTFLNIFAYIGDMKKIDWVVENLKYGKASSSFTFGAREDKEVWIKNAPHVMYYAALNGNLENIKYLQNNIEKFGNQEKELYGAVESNSIKILDYLLNRGYTFIYDVYGLSEFDVAINNDNFEILDYLLKKGCRFGSRTFELAIKNGNIKIINWLITNKCEIDIYAQKNIDSPNYVELINIFELNKIPIHNPTILLRNIINYETKQDIIPSIEKYYKINKTFYFEHLIKNNKLNIIKLLRGYRNNKRDLAAPVFEYHYNTFNIVIRCGNIEMLKWMLKDGLKYKYYEEKYRYKPNEVKVLLREQVKNILKDFLEENNIKIKK